MLEVGAFHPAWGDIHLGPLNALKAHELLGGGAFMPVHWGTFSLAMHAWDEPVETLLESAAAPELLLMPMLGEPVEPGQRSLPRAWWRVDDRASAEAAPIPPGAPIQATTHSNAPSEKLPWPLD
jgi:hypothetical protein